MTGEKSLQGGLTRRSFLKASGAAAGALGIAGAAGMVTAEGWLSPTEAHAEPEERVAHLCHQFHYLDDALPIFCRQGNSMWAKHGKDSVFV